MRFIKPLCFFGGVLPMFSLYVLAFRYRTCFENISSCQVSPFLGSLVCLQVRVNVVCVRMFLRYISIFFFSVVVGLFLSLSLCLLALVVYAACLHLKWKCFRFSFFLFS